MSVANNLIVLPFMIPTTGRGEVSNIVFDENGIIRSKGWDFKKGIS